MSITALYPGSFDPVTIGHLDIASRVASLFDQLIVAVYDAPAKEVLFTTEERVFLFQQAVEHLPNIKVIPYKGLTADLARQFKAQVLIRGLRMGSDFEREFELALMNKQIAPEIETLAMMSSLEYQFLRASLIKEVSQLGGDISRLVPRHVAEALKEKLKPNIQK